MHCVLCKEPIKKDGPLNKSGKMHCVLKIIFGEVCVVFSKLYLTMKAKIFSGNIYSL
jgi:hypothetical protein